MKTLIFAIAAILVITVSAHRPLPKREESKGKHPVLVLEIDAVAKLEESSIEEVQHHQHKDRPHHHPSHPHHQHKDRPHHHPSHPHHPSGKPTRPPHPPPTGKPTHPPRPPPTGKPTRPPRPPPTGKPTRPPRPPPTGEPTRPPRPPPTGKPTRPPSPPPTGEPTRPPPTGKPTRPPRPPPTDEPTTTVIENTPSDFGSGNAQQIEFSPDKSDQKIPGRDPEVDNDTAILF